MAASSSDPISRLADATMRIFAELAATALPASPYKVAADRLGSERVATIVVESLRASLKRLLTDDAEAVLAELGPVPGFGAVAASSRLLGIAQEAIGAVIAEGRR